MQKIGFFGGTGFVGRALCRYIRENGLPQHVYTISRNQPPSPSSLNLIADVTKEINPDSLPDFDAVIHGVSDSTDGPSLASHLKISKSILSSLNIADFALKKKVKKIIYLSSGAVYGETSRKSESEAAITINTNSPQAAYALGKLASENFLKSFCVENNIQLVILRAFTFGGPDLPTNTHYALGNFIDDAKNNRDIIINGNGKDKRSYLHQDDLSRVLLDSMAMDGPFNLYNVGSGSAIELAELARKIATLSGKDIGVKILNKTQSRNSHYVPAIEKLVRERGFEQSKNLDELILSMLSEA